MQQLRRGNPLLCWKQQAGESQVHRGLCGLALRWAKTAEQRGLDLRLPHFSTCTLAPLVSYRTAEERLEA